MGNLIEQHGMDARHQRFADSYLLSFNATKAAIDVGYSSATAGQTGYKLLRREDVQQYLAERRIALATSTGVTLERTVAELARVAFADLRDVVEWGTRAVKVSDALTVDMAFAEPKDSDTLSPDAAAAVAEVSQGKAGFKVKLHNKTNALDMLMKHLGGYERDNTQKGDAIARLVEAAQGRALPLGRKKDNPA